MNWVVVMPLTHNPLAAKKKCMCPRGTLPPPPPPYFKYTRKDSITCACLRSWNLVLTSLMRVSMLTGQRCTGVKISSLSWRRYSTYLFKGRRVIAPGLKVKSHITEFIITKRRFITSEALTFSLKFPLVYNRTLIPNAITQLNQYRGHPVWF